MTYLPDGNAIAGGPFAVFGRERTVVVGRWRACGTASASAVAELCVYPCAPVTVARCPSSHAVVIVLVTIGYEWNVHLPALELQTSVSLACGF